MVKQGSSSSLSSGGSRDRSSNSSSKSERANKYTGVRKRQWGKWVSEIRLPKSRDRIWLGSYDTPEKAARAFDAALFCLRGTTANFNFPHQPPHIPGGTSLSRSQIQAVAAAYASASSSSTDCMITTHDLLSSSNSTSSSEEEDQSPSPSYVSQLQTDQSDPWTSPLTNLDDDFNSYINSLGDHTIISSSTTSVPDFAIYPGFDDYFMPMPPMPSSNDDDYVESDGIYFQGSSLLWNF